MGKLYDDEMKILRGEKSREYIKNSDTPFGLYSQIKIGNWLHRNLKDDNMTSSELILEAILHYMKNGKVKHDRKGSTLEHSATIPAKDRLCMLSVKENGVHIMITVERQQERAWKIKDVCGKQGAFDDVNARTGAFKSVVYGLLHNVSFDFLPDEADCVLLQAELVVPRTFMRLTNQHDVTSLVFSYGKACSDQHKHEILNKLELRFFNVGGLRFHPVDHSTTYERYDLKKVSDILELLVKTEFFPQYAKGTKRRLRICSSLYFDMENVSNEWEICVAEITEFVTRYQKQEGFIFRAEGCQWIKYKRIYSDSKGVATRIPGCIVPVLIGPSDNLDTIESVVVAPPVKRGGTECKELLIIDFGIEHDPDGETGVYYRGGAKWSCLDYIRGVLSRGRIVQHTQTTDENRCTYKVAMPDGRELVYHCRNLAKLGHRVAFVCIGQGIEPCFCLKFNELIIDPDRQIVRLDTPVLMGFVLPGGPNRDLESKSLAELIEIMTPPCDDHVYRKLTTQTKSFFNSLIPGSLQRRSDYANDLPLDISQQDAFLSRVVSCYDDFLEGSVTDVPLAKRYKLLAKHHRERPAAVAQLFPGFQFRHGKGQAPRIRFNRPDETAPSPIETPPPAARALPVPVAFTIMKTPDSCGVYNNTSWDKLNALKEVGRKFGIIDMTTEQLSKLFRHTIDRRTTAKGKENWEKAISFLSRPLSLQQGEKAFLTTQAKFLVDLVNAEEAKNLLFDENGRERDIVVQCVRRSVLEDEWIETVKHAESTSTSAQVDLTTEERSTATVAELPAKRNREPSPQDDCAQDDEDLHVGPGTSSRSRYVSR